MVYIWYMEKSKRTTPAIQSQMMPPVSTGTREPPCSMDNQSITIYKSCGSNRDKPIPNQKQTNEQTNKNTHTHTDRHTRALYGIYSLMHQQSNNNGMCDAAQSWQHSHNTQMAPAWFLFWMAILTSWQSLRC